MLGVVMFLPTAEDVIKWYRLSEIDRHHFDARGIAAVQQGRLDAAYLYRWCLARGLLELWERVQDDAAV